MPAYGKKMCLRNCIEHESRIPKWFKCDCGEMTEPRTDRIMQETYQSEDKDGENRVDRAQRLGFILQ